MAGFYLGLNRGAGDNIGAIVGGAASGSTDMELFWDSGKNLTKRDLLIFIELLENYINSNAIGDVAPGTYLPPL